MRADRFLVGGRKGERVAWIVANVAYATILVVAAVTSDLPGPARQVPDVVSHAVAYGIQAMLLYALLMDGLPHRAALLCAWCGAIAFGLLTEGLQALHPIRTTELKDIAANACGATVATVALALVSFRREQGSPTP